MRRYRVVLKNLKNADEKITLATASTEETAQAFRKEWRKVLGAKSWTVDRSPGADTLDHLLLTVEKVNA